MGWQVFLVGMIIFIGTILHIFYRCGTIDQISSMMDRLDTMPFWMPLPEILSIRMMLISSFSFLFLGAVLAAMHL